jgi:hypothetical protein
VLPLWRDLLQIVLTPQQVTIVRLGAGLKPREVFNKSMPCVAPKHDETVWQPAIRVMRLLLKQAGSGNANAKIILSNHFVRFQLVKAQPDLGSIDEEKGFVRFSFAEVYGNEADHWSLRWGSGLDIAAQVASAIDQTLLDNIENILAEADIKLTSMQPYLMAAFNHVRQSIDVKPVWFVLVEEGRICIALLLKGNWKMLHSSKLGNDWAAELPNTIEREFQRIGLTEDVGNILLCLPGYFDHKRLKFQNLSVRILTMSPESLHLNKVLSIARVEVKQ